jgi:DNA-directed RNA polymerase specialized sigma24 family protein
MPALSILPILSIYFLGHTFDHVKAPVVRVNRAYFDAATGEQIHEKEEFIESLTHDSIIIQIPYLEGRRRTELEQLLALFDQSSVAANPHFLSVDEDELPERYRPLLRRLQKAVADPVVRETMEGEDDIIEEIKDYQRLIMSKEQIIEAEDQAIEARQKRMERAVLKAYAAGVSMQDLAEIFELSETELTEMIGDAR